MMENLWVHCYINQLNKMMDLYLNYLRLEEMVVLMLKETLVEMLLDPLLAVQEVMLVVKGESCDN